MQTIRLIRLLSDMDGIGMDGSERLQWKVVKKEKPFTRGPFLRIFNPILV
jgi:hypothetical protein